MIKNRKPNRLENYDYAQEGAYFITLCTHNRARLFNMELSACYYAVGAHAADDGIGGSDTPFASVQNQIIHNCVNATACKFTNASIDKYVIMPDHLHFLITIKERHEGRSLPDIIHYFKTITTNNYILSVKDGALLPFDKKLWQKSYYDHIIRNQQDYNECWDYIDKNPVQWLVAHNIEP